jgi:hypothetical protein
MTFQEFLHCFETRKKLNCSSYKCYLSYHAVHCADIREGVKVTNVSGAPNQATTSFNYGLAMVVGKLTLGLALA